MVGNTFKVKVKPEMIKWARESAGWSVKKIADKLKISVQDYKKIEDGQILPTFKQIEIFSDCFKRSTAFFFSSDIPENLSLTFSYKEHSVKLVYDYFTRELLFLLKEIKRKPNMQNGDFKLWWDNKGNLYAISIANFAQLLEKLNKDISISELFDIWKKKKISIKNISKMTYIKIPNWIIEVVITLMFLGEEEKC